MSSIFSGMRVLLIDSDIPELSMKNVFRKKYRNNSRRESNPELTYFMMGGDYEKNRKLTTSKKEISGSSLHKKADIKVKFHNNKLNRVGIHNVRINKMLRK